MANHLTPDAIIDDVLAHIIAEQNKLVEAEEATGETRTHDAG